MKKMKMKKKEKSRNGSFKRYYSESFGFGELPSRNDSDVHKILSHFNGGFKLNYVRDDDCSIIERMQSSLF